MIYTKEIINDVIGALEQRGFRIRQTNFLTGGGWKMRLLTRGGLLRGAPVLQYEPEQRRIRILKQHVFAHNVVGDISLDDKGTVEQLTTAILSVLASQWS
ncbi:MAG: hypothetical protein ABFC77_13705 [Thermoguttaceae bacterium]